MLSCQTGISKLSSTENRATAIGRLSLSYSSGMVIGSTVGGYLSNYVGYRGTAGVSAILTILVILCNFIFLPNLENQSKITRDKKQKNGFSEFLGVLFTPRIFSLIIMIMPVTVGMSAYRSMFSLAAANRFTMKSQDLGFYLSVTALFGLFSNIFVVSFVTRRLRDVTIILLSCVALVFSYVSLPVVSSYYELLVWTAPTTIATTLLYTLSSSTMSLVASEQNTGAAISLSHGSRSFAGIVSPLIGGFLFDSFGFLGLAYFVAFCCCLSFVLVLCLHNLVFTNKLKKGE